MRGRVVRPRRRATLHGAGRGGDWSFLVVAWAAHLHLQHITVQPEGPHQGESVYFEAFFLGSAPHVQSETAQAKCCAPTADCCVQDVSITRVVHVRRKGGNYLGALAETLLTFCLSAPCALFSHRNMLLTVYATTHLAYIPGSQIGQVSRVLYITNKTGIRIAIVKVADHVGVACPYAKCVRCQSSALAQPVAGNWRGLGLRGS